MADQALFSAFDPVSSKQWKQKIQFDLKGVDYNKTLVWESLEGISVKPFYHSEDLKNHVSFQLPKDHACQIGQTIYAGNIELANKKALDSLQRGATSLVFELPKANTDWSLLLQNIPLERVTIHLNPHFLDIDAVKRLHEFIGAESTNIFFNYDIIGNLTKSGNWYQNLKTDHKRLDDIQELVKNVQKIAALSVDMALYQNAGASMIQQLAYGLAHANEYLNHSKNIQTNLTNKALVFKVAVGSNYFFEIAKLKALRWLWKSLTVEYGIKSECHILAFPSKRNKTIYDYNVNMLRTTSECMSAVLGGANTVSNLPYDALYHKSNEFGERIARNQLLILKEEGYFDEAVNASEGAYYIEVLTEQLAQKALKLFKQLENSGGFLKALIKGIIQKKINVAADREQQLFDSGSLILLGTNMHQNPNDKMKENLELFPFLKQHQRKTLIEPILEKRLAESMERQRLDEETPTLKF